MRTWWFGSLAVAMALATAGCHKDDAKAGEHEGPGSAPPPPPAPVVVELYVDDVVVGRVAPAHAATWPRLDTLLPLSARRLGTWETIYLKGKTPKPSELQKPSQTYPELVPALFPGEGDEPAFGMFDPVELAKHGKPALREDHVHEVRIKLAQNSGRGEHDQGQGGGADPMSLKLTFKTKAGDKVIDGKQLLAIPREAMPGQTGDGKGWPLTTLLEAAGVKTFDKLLLADAAGMNLNLDKSDFVPGKSIPFVKLNRQGALRFRVFKKQGDGWEQTGDLRGLVSVQIIK
jgi:hypothetical protein